MKFANTFSNISIAAILAVSMCCSGAKTYAEEQKWDFEYGFKHLNEVGADKYVVENKNLRKYTEWQNPPITYLGPKSNDVDCSLTRKFTFDRPTSTARLKVNLATYNFGGGRVGKASCWASVDGKDWKLVLDNPTPSRIDSYKGFDDELPKELTGSKELWVQMRLHVSRAPNSSYTLAQFGRSTANAKSNVFEIKAKLETAEKKKPTDFTLSDATVEENKPEGTVVGSFSASSVDKGKYDFRKGLVAYYPFDGNASDMSGNGIHGTVFGATLSTDRNGNPSKSYSFDGSNDRIGLPNTNDLKLQKISLAMWVKFSDVLGGQIISNEPNAAEGFAIDNTSDKKIGFKIMGGVYDNTLTPTDSFSENSWVFLTATYEGSIKHIYLDGVLSKSENSTVAISYGNTPTQIGTGGFYSIYPNHSNSYFKGSIDEVRIYDRALSADEVQALYDLENKTPFWLSSFSGDISIKDLDADAAGNVFASGDFSGTADFGSTSLTASGSTDAFVMKLSPSGNVIWVKKTDGPGRAHARGLSVDSSGNAYITGQFASGSVRFGNHSLSLQRESDPFFAKLTPDGKWAWANRVGTSAWSGGEGLAADAEGNHIVTGYFYGSSNFGSTRLGSSGWYDAFLGKRDSSGNWLWTNKFGSSSSDFGIDVDIDGQGNLVHLGDFKNTITLGGTTLVSKGGGDLNGKGDFVVRKLDANGRSIWAKRAGSTRADRGSSIVTDQHGNVYLTGYYSGSADFGSTTLANSGGKDGVVAKLSSQGDWLWALPVSGSNDVVASHLEFLPSGNLLLAGTFQGTITIGSKTITSSGENDLFMAELTPGGQWVSALRHGGTGNDSATLTRNSSGDVFWGGNYSDGFAFNGQTYTSVGSTKAFVALYANAQPSPNQTPVFTGSSTFTLVDGNGSTDNANFTLDANGTLKTAGSFDFETKSSHSIRVRATDENNGTLEKVFVVAVTDVPENAAPVFTSSPTAFVRENETFAIDANATDPDGDALTFSLTGGEDREKFSINAATGLLNFRSAPDFENPADADANNHYIVELTVSDGELTATQVLAISVTDVKENAAPLFTSSPTAFVRENETFAIDANATDPDGDALTFTLTGGEDGEKFSVNAATGLLSFRSAPDFENPADADANNHYVVELTVSDGELTGTQVLAVSVTDVNEHPVPPPTPPDRTPPPPPDGGKPKDPLPPKPTPEPEPTPTPKPIDLRAGLLAHYPYTGNANDHSGNEHHLEVNGSTPVEDRFGMPDSAYAFDGKDDFMFADIEERKGDFSISLWAKAENIEQSRYRSVINVFDKTPGSKHTCQIHTSGGRYPTYQFFSGNAESFALVKAEWQHLAVTVSGKVIRFYENGERVYSQELEGGAANKFSNIIIGRNRKGRAMYHGTIDDVYVYERAVSDAEVERLYNGGFEDSDGDGLTDAYERGYGRYKLVKGSYDWRKAKADAEKRGGHLATITSQAEWEAVREVVGELPSTYWLGGTDEKTEGVWEWITGEIWKFTKWSKNEPNNLGDEDYLQTWGKSINGNRLWNDNQFNENRNGYILEYGYYTDANDSDSDNDGVNDGVEVAAKTDPNNPLSRPTPDKKAPGEQPGPPPSLDHGKKIDELTKDNEAKAKRIKELELAGKGHLKTISDLNASNAALAQKVEARDKTIASLRSERNGLKQQLVNAREDVANAGHKLSTTEKELEAAKKVANTPFVNGWIYDPEQGWLFTNADLYPSIYSSTTKSWHHYEPGSAKPRLFYSYKDEAWEAWDPIPDQDKGALAKGNDN